MKNSLKTITTICLLFFSGILSNAETPAWLGCTTPNTPTYILHEVYNCPQAFLASTNVGGGADGYEWSVVNGVIASGQGTSLVTVNPQAKNITLSVRSFNTDGIGGFCYSSWYNLPITFQYRSCN
ncbi:MAG: hypothetical protein RIC35_08090 [Marinoscillum sp.]